MSKRTDFKKELTRPRPKKPKPITSTDDIYQVVSKCQLLERVTKITVPVEDIPIAQNIFKDANIPFSLKDNTFTLTPVTRTIEDSLDYLNIDESELLREEIAPEDMDEPMWTLKDVELFMQRSEKQILKLIKANRFKQVETYGKFLYFNPDEVRKVTKNLNAEADRLYKKRKLAKK